MVDEYKHRLIEMVQANLPTQGNEDECDDSTKVVGAVWKGRPELPGAIHAGILAMVKAACPKR